MAHQLMMDFETMGKDSLSCAAVDCAFMIFDDNRFLSDNPYTLKDIDLVVKLKLSVADQVKNYGCVVEEDTLAFWQKQPKEVRQHVKPTENDLTVKEFVDKTYDLLYNNRVKYWWSRSNTFDPIIIERLFRYADRKRDLDNVLKFYLVRDTRTYIDAKFDFSLKKNGFVPISDEAQWERTFKEHDSAWDVLADVLRMQAIIRAENDLPLI